MTVIPGLVEFGSLEQVYPLVITLLKRLGAWGSRRRLFGLYGFFLCHFFLRLLPSVLYLDAGDIHSLVRHLGEIVFISLLYPVFIVYVWKLPKLMLMIKILQRAFAEYCGPNQHPVYRETIAKTNRFIRNICRFYFAYTGLNIPVYIIMPPALTFYKYFTWSNSTEPFYFNFPNELPYMDHLNMGHYIVVQSLIAPIFFCSALFLAMKSMVYYSLIKYVSLMFKLVIKRIELLDNSITIGGGSRLEHAVDDVIRAHYLALRCAQLLEELISPILLAQFLGCVIVWCLLLFYITLNASGVGALTTLILCEIVAFEMLAFSFFGSELTEISESLAHEIYSFQWYDAPMTVQKKVLLMSVRAQQIVGITAFRFYYVSIEQFGKAVQTTYSFYLVMQKLFE
ncbi:AAEL011895-PA [Aedes aegypti]|uniref:Odorant receptor n=2 Tax=Aedes aegypti TaxID=7159 RepID=A0A1S7UED9_AEDAE|nr:AAEL011895-PA [Aedes aegypti]DAA80390.1 TPA_exp: odorant receptor 48 [Aedes aegypti]